MKLHRMEFKHWDDEHTVLLRKERGVGSGHKEEDARWADDPEWYCRQHFHKAKNGDGPYFLNRRGRKLLDDGGPFEKPFVDGEKLVEVGYGGDAFVVCPGPSLKGLDLSLLSERFTLAVNSAGFAMRPSLWVMAESGYALWLVKQGKRATRALAGVSVIATARVATVLRAQASVAQCYVVRWEEEFVVPARTPAVSITNALVTAWEMGFKRVFVLGMDLSKNGGAYLEGLPHTKEGAANPFDDQIRALAQFKLPDFEVVNCSPLSREVLPFPYLSYADLLAEVVEC